MLLNINCNICKKPFEIEADAKDIKKWKDGELIQHALSYLSIEDRDLLIFGICGDCFKDSFDNES